LIKVWQRAKGQMQLRHLPLYVPRRLEKVILGVVAQLARKEVEVHKGPFYII